MSFELSLVVTHQTKAGRGSPNLYTALWKQVFRPLWIFFKEEMSLNIVECKLFRLISHSTSPIRKLWHLLQKNKGIRRSEIRNFLIVCESVVPGVIYFNTTLRDRETVTSNIHFWGFHREIFLSAIQAYMGYLKY